MNEVKSRTSRHRLLVSAAWFLACVVLLIEMFLPLFRAIVHTEDYVAHITIARQVASRGIGHTERPGFELMTLAVSRFFPLGSRLLLGAIWVSVVAMVCKFAVSAYLIQRQIIPNFQRDVAPYWSLILAFVLMFLAPITLDWRDHPLRPGHSPVHLGQISGFIFHNPTTVVVFPFALLLFHASFQERHLLAGVLAAVQCFVKPNFVAAWVPAFALLQFWRHHFAWRTLALSAVAIVPAVGVLLFQYTTTRKLGTGIIVAPFRAWNGYSESILLSCLRSLAFPLAFCAIYFRELRGRADLWFAWGIFAVAFAQYVLLYIAGATYSGNWSWGRYLSIYIVFLLCLSRFAVLAVRRDNWQGPWRAAGNVLLLGLVALHLSSGFRYYLEGVWYRRW